jgi:hypothetical protein
MLFQDLPLGGRFKYKKGGDTWVVLEKHDHGFIAKWKGLDGAIAGQSICCFADTIEECKSADVIVCED